jgi:energy-converting hydrogenase Eha subunit A
MYACIFILFERLKRPTSFAFALGFRNPVVFDRGMMGLPLLETRRPSRRPSFLTSGTEPALLCFLLGLSAYFVRCLGAVTAYHGLGLDARTMSLSPKLET